MIKTIILLKESGSLEKRVALDPKNCERLVKAGFKVIVTPDAGINAYFSNNAYEQAGAVVESPTFDEKAIILSINAPTKTLTQKFKAGSLSISLLDPYRNLSLVELLAKQGVDALALEFIPRITRAQSMDVLSSQATISGYQSVLIGADLSPRFFPMLTTAAGTIRPAKVLVIGAGVAGLQAIATARRLGAQVEAYDIRPDAKEQVESLGAKLVDTGVNAAGEGGYARELTEEERAQQAAALAKHVKEAHVVITTAAIPGKRAPIIVTKEMVESMLPGAVIVDMAAETGGNCELTKVGETIKVGEVIITGPRNLPSTVAIHASEMFSQNIYNLIAPFITEDGFSLNLEDEVIKDSLITHEGKIISDRISSLISA
ncbi:NAD(P) transhydrogenase subunit alpha [Ignatzschineria cameli]|uniref:proton-translocating NAD(P)(+) transhydrogenase n=1 Tax=Ignatzschineria cameli TaxID=2182793 RepID=A0A2U2ARE7_9GAMM|nr:NAD(P) transhydrogenase subunit alpha [Ignatzschineria cameli]PWD86830.1 NAD(P)(+) transhydrogenase (Re/Si-specific) subunit alpha [Ignatzschineria cameli]PWD91804.1 NAD(P)(+) transhydrogenase (Re/Si-specific) subunit alpha [Ignatzschineria cameli]PWD93610.1 NAD(P)(+) transhydrogenase (Re/Si-specific) subunit alpha [Ignatzschineria cameli]PWD94352.1 NAD(P)(+) transhydrogenase (Re/Si-specific) subunit alpha [Ignatzschineria cameli]